jgi:ubiquinol oxidase
LGLQGVVFNLYFIMYLLAPKYCHRFVGFLEEGALRVVVV